MEKIIVRCNADYLQYEFPKRKWYQIGRYNRIATMRLAFAQTDELECDITLEIWEEYPEEPQYIVEDSFRERLYEKMLGYYEKNYAATEHLIVLDNGENMADFLYRLSDNRNYLSVRTDNPENYETVTERIEQNYGLVAMFFSSKKELCRYIKRVTEKKKVFLITGRQSRGMDGEQADSVAAKRMASLLCCLPKGSFFLDLEAGGINRELVLKKRLGITYASIPIFLDNIVKNRYNAVVNEGITIQVKNYKKQVWRRKGNEDGRKEEYPDL